MYGAVTAAAAAATAAAAAATAAAALEIQLKCIRYSLGSCEL